MRPRPSHRLAAEVAEASRASASFANAATYPNELVRTARALERMITRRRKLRRELKTVDTAIRRAKRELKILAGRVQ